MLIVYILAVIGGFFVFGMAGFVVFIAITARGNEPNGGEEVLTCALTGEKCIYTSERQTCNGCPISEEADR